MVRLLSYVALSALIIVPTFASSVWDLETRDVADVEMEGLFARQEGNTEYADLAARKLHLGKLGNIFKKMAGMLFRRELTEDEAAVFAREMEELYSRQEGNTEYADLAARKFSFGKMMKGAASLLFRRELTEDEAAVFAREMEELYSRQEGNTEYSDLAARKFSFGKMMKGAASLLFRRELNDDELAVFAREMEEMYSRQEGNTEYADLAARKFSFGKMMKGAASLLFRRELDANRVHPPLMKHELSDDNLRRSFDDDLAERDFNDELLERDLEDELYVRDLTEADLFERSYDDLD